ncbi:MAG: bifunctional serine/threonine-protein kinase/formylglycine-generating enzyme family protein [Candidatus Hydrogenedentes bacterium]|nr:bifunctional serine/threonine-protein kinase/formylglycine-generating enzyme family protein [Candidatus Hydrogenedentota bacterium]
MTRIKCPKCEFINEEGRPTCSRCGNTLPLVKIQAVAPPPPLERLHPQMNQIQFRRGQVVAGRYTVLNMIGRGGMGCIYHVRDNALHEEVALKTLLPQFVRDKMVVERFFNEARIARALSHPNIVRVHDIGVTGDIIYISMELIRGKSLRSMLETSVTEDYIPFKEAMKITDQLCAALEYAHRHTIHRDIKPENVMVCDDGTVKLMDFGISKLMDSSRLTGTSIIMGTPMYMSPEQLRNSANVDARADIYSIGVMLYEILTGNLPTSLSKPASQITRGIPSAVDSIVAKCVEPDPEKRFQSVTDLRAALERFVTDGKPVRTGKTHAGTIADEGGELEEAAPWGRRIVGGLLIAAIAGLTAAGFYTLEVARRAQVEKALAATALPQMELEPGQVFKQLAELRGRLRNLLAEIAGRYSFAATVLAGADEAWEKAAAAAVQDPSAAMEPARVALQAYLGPLAVPQGMVFVPPGNTFIAGTQVTVGGFFMDAAEVTVADYKRFCDSKNWTPPYDLASVPRDIPVSGVTFYDALAYAAWKKKSLPTEPQWARAAYGDTSVFYPWGGGAWKDGAANTLDGDDGYEYAAPAESLQDSAANTLDGDDGQEYAAPVESLQDSAAKTPEQVKSFPLDKSWVGCYDMVGNVAEWTRSMYSDAPYDPADGREDLAAITFGTLLTIRGGSFMGKEMTLQTRVPYAYEGAWGNLGFRCAAEMPNSLEGLRALAEKTLAGR